MLLQPLNVPGKITSLAHDGCLIELGAVVASVSRATLDQLAQSMQELRKLRGAAEGEVAAVQLPQMTDWTSIGYRMRNPFAFELCFSYPLGKGHMPRLVLKAPSIIF